MKKEREKTPIIGIKLDTREELYFESAWSASKQLGVFDQQIKDVLLGFYQTAKGYTFKYVNKPYNFEEMRDRRLKNRQKKTPVRTYGSISRFKHKTWGGINQRVVNPTHKITYHTKSNQRYLTKGIRLEMTKDQFYQWCDVQKETILGLYAQGKVPSIDRIDPSGNYSIDNIRILDMRENRKLGIEQSKKRTSKLIIGISVDDPTKTIEISSATAAKRQGFAPTSIRARLFGETKYPYKGYYWSYANKDPPKAG